MGWVLKVGLFVLAVVAANFGAWIIAVPIVVYLILPLFWRKDRSTVRDGKAGHAGKSRASLGKAVGVALLALSVVAFVSGGKLSPVVFAAAGFLALFRPGVLFWISFGVRPVDDSVLLRGRLFPFLWFALAEGKVSTRELGGALSGLRGRILLVSAPAPRILFVFSAVSLTRRGAEERLLGSMQNTVRALMPLGVYLLPLDQGAALEASRLGARVPKVPDDGLRQFISSADYGALMVEGLDGFVTRFEFYSRDGEGERPSPRLSQASRRPRAPILLREALQANWQRTGAPQPDRYTSFLSSIAATQGETLGQRMTQAAQGSEGGPLLVASLGGPEVQVSSAQLQAILRIYP